MLRAHRPMTFVLAMLAAVAHAQVDPEHSYRGRSAVRLVSGLVELVVLTGGGSIASITVAGDPQPLNPLWDSLRGDRERGRAERSSGALGHFVCVDGFGPVSPEEQAAGMLGHGEAHRLEWSTEFAGLEGGTAVLRQQVTLPRVREVLRREIRLPQDESMVYVKARLESLLDFDRPVNWAEHATIGSPFLERGVTVVDISPARAITRPREGSSRNGLAHRLVSGAEFEWPMAPLRSGGTVDLRAAPLDSHSLDHTGHRLDPESEWAFVTALHPEKRLLLGYVFRPREFPWLQTWEHYPREGLMARGLEFGTQAFDLPRREVVTQGRLFGTLLYRWLPARSAIEAGYAMFLTRTPEGFLGVDSVEWRSGILRLSDGHSGQSIELRARGEI
ncbi:MAG: hypothetical protein OXN89_06290 [Bryobacterales bacterium]|nr:hypothetical protein [Bryobacterales bacterium]